MAIAAPSEDWPRTVAEFEDSHARQPERWEFVDGRPRLIVEVMSPVSEADDTGRKWQAYQKSRASSTTSCCRRTSVW